MKNWISICLLFCFIQGVNSQEVPKLETFSLKNGLKVHLMQYGKIPAVSIQFVVNTGEKNEAPGQQGYCEITSSLLLQGNSKFTQEQQNDLAFKLGGELNSNSGKDHTTLTANFLNKDFDQAMDLFSSAILHPSFNKEKLDQMLSYLSDYNNPAKMDIVNLADNFSDLFIYGTANPLGRNYYREQLKLITTDKIKEFHAFNYTPKNSSLIVCGNIDAAQVKSVVEKYFGQWTSTYGEVNGVALEMPQIKKKETGFVNRSGSTQCALQWNKIAPGRKDKDAIAFAVANRIFNNVLFSEIREKGGKTYSIGSSHQPSRFSNLFIIGCSVRNDEMLSTVQLFDKTLAAFSAGTLSNDDFEKALNSIKVGLMSAELPSEVISFYNPVIFDFEKRKNYLNDLAALKIEDVQKVIKKYFNPESYKLVISGDESVVSDQLSKIPGLIKFKISDIEKDN